MNAPTKQTRQTRQTRPTNNEPLWSNIEGRMRVWGKEIPYKNSSFMSYSTSIGSKNQDDEYDNVYFNVRFRKDEGPNLLGAFEIYIKSGFLTVTTDKDGNCYHAIMVLDYELRD